jgi:hypothetical protein
MLTLANQDRTIILATSISHALTATVSWRRKMYEPLERKRKNFENSEGDNGFVVGCEWEREVRTSGVRLGWWEEQANEV